MANIKAKKIKTNLKQKENKRDYFFYFSLIFSCFIFLFCLEISSLKISKDFLQSLKQTIQTVKPTEELFDDNGGVKLVSILFPVSSQEVNSQILNFKFKVEQYDTALNNDGIITLFNPSGLIYATESGCVTITELSDEVDELKIEHALGIETVYSGKFIFGVKDNEFVQKGQPLAVILSPKLEFFITHNDEILQNISLVQGELVWQD